MPITSISNYYSVNKSLEIYKYHIIHRKALLDYNRKSAITDVVHQWVLFCNDVIVLTINYLVLEL